ncbi:Pentatricopeptide repeat-containing protein At5g14080 [Linum perenne]
MRPATELATRIGRALISASTAIKPDRSWNPSLEKTLYSLGCRESLTPSLVARVIDPHLLSHHSLALGFFNWATQQPGFAHNSISYQSIFKSLSSSRQFGAIDSLLKQLKAQSLPLDSLTYSFVVKTLLQGKRTLNAFWVFNEAKSELSCLEPKVCNSLLAALSSEGYLENAYKVFEEMTRREVGFTTTGFGVFIWKLCAKNNLDVVLAVLDMVNNDGKSSINGSIIALLVVHGLCKASRVDEALWVLNELRMKKCKPDFMAYRIVAEALRSTGNVVDVNLVLKMKRKLGVAPRSQFLLSCKVLQGLSNDIGHTDSHVVLMKCLAEANEFRAAAEHVKWIQDTSPSMFHTIVSEVSASLSSSINPGLLQQLVQAMSEQGVDFRDRRNVFSR